MRVYETHKDVERQSQVEREVAQLWGVYVRRNPRYYGHDNTLFDASSGDGTMLALAEIKCRPDISSDTFPTYMISLKKCTDALDMAGHLKIPFYLVVKWADRTGWIKVGEIRKSDVRWAGRIDRGDPDDQEPCVFFPTEWFRPIRDTPLELVQL